jgi:hypothetical protein
VTIKYPPTLEEIAECELEAARCEDAADAMPEGPARSNLYLRATYFTGLAELHRQYLPVGIVH